MAQTSSSQLTIIDSDSALREIGEAENIYELWAQIARILVGMATNLQTIAARGNASHPLHITLGGNPLTLNVNIHKKSVTVIKELVVEHIKTIQQRVDDVHAKHQETENRYKELLGKHEALERAHEALKRRFDTPPQSTGPQAQPAADQ